MSWEDEEIIEEFFLESLIDVYEDSVTINLPDTNSINIPDDELDTIFYHPEIMFDKFESEVALFWVNLIPHVFRIRQNKRDMYFEMGVCFD